MLFFFFFSPQRVVSLRADKNVCVCLTRQLSSRCTYLLQSYGMQRISVRTKVEGEHPKDTTLAAVLISWLTAQVIYRGWRFLQLPSQDRVLKKKKKRQHHIIGSEGNMIDILCVYVNPPEVSLAS